MEKRDEKSFVIKFLSKPAPEASYYFRIWEKAARFVVVVAAKDFSGLFLSSGSTAHSENKHPALGRKISDVPGNWNIISNDQKKAAHSNP